MNKTELQEHFLKIGPAAQRAASKRNAPIIAMMLGKRKPYTREELMARHEYDVAVFVRDRWVKVKTTTQFISNGLLEQAKAALGRGEFSEFQSDKTNCNVILTNERDFGFSAVAYPL